MLMPTDPLAGPRSLAPPDQAHGLRCLFGRDGSRFVALAHNPFSHAGGLVLERLTSAYASMGLRTLVVDAADTARCPSELTVLDLASGMETLSPQVSFLAARGLPRRYVDARGSTSGFLKALADTAPWADVVVVHAGAGDLGRLFARRDLRPLLVAGLEYDAIKSAYAAMKVLVQRAGLYAFDLVVPAPAGTQWPHKVADRLADCADRFLGATLREWVTLDLDEPSAQAVSPPLLSLAQGLLRTDDYPTLYAQLDPVTPQPTTWQD